PHLAPVAFLCCPPLQGVLLHEHIPCRNKAETLVGLLCGVIGGLDVQPQAYDISRLLGLLANMFVKRPEDAAAAGIGPDIDPLDPPEPAIAPVAELEGDLHL